MAVKAKVYEEITRASIIATHSAASMLAGAPRLREAARLMRAAEALSRTALAVVSAAHSLEASPAAPAAAVGGDGPKKKRVRKKKKGKSVGMAVDVVPKEPGESSVGAAAPPVPQKQPSREPSPSRPGSASSPPSASTELTGIAAGLTGGVVPSPQLLARASELELQLEAWENRWELLGVLMRGLPTFRARGTQVIAVDGVLRVVAEAGGALSRRAGVLEQG